MSGVRFQVSGAEQGFWSQRERAGVRRRRAGFRCRGPNKDSGVRGKEQESGVRSQESAAIGEY